MPSYTRTGLEIRCKRSSEVMNPNLKFVQIVVSLYGGSQMEEVHQ